MGKYSYTQRMNARHAIEEIYEWEKWQEEIPYLNFKPEWKVKVVPPFRGAIARFYVDYNDNFVSIYLDCYNELGYVGQPYWEIYPNYQNENERFYINETDELLEAIDKSLMERVEEEY